MIWIVLLIAVGLFAGRLRLPRVAGWLLVLILAGAAHGALLQADPIERMVGMCAVLLGALKGLTYTEWGGELTWPRYLIFSLCWFGMDPGSFLKRREGLSWKTDVALGMCLIVIGTLGAWVVWTLEVKHILLMFIPMSLGFHFGALRVLKGGQRKAGFPVRTLFPNLLKTNGVGDFWSRRWNTGYSQMMQRAVGRPIGEKFGKKWGLMAVFVVSGLLHELAITLPVQNGYGLPLLYFTGHGFLVLLENRLGRSFGKILTLLAVGIPLGFLFPPAFQDHVIRRCLNIFDFMS